MSADRWHPTATLDMLETRARLLRATRDYFDAHAVLEVETPALDEFGVTDPHVAPIPVTLSVRPERQHYLQTSPEYAMKRLLAAGAPDIYQICRVFRDGELGRMHQAEFTMIEWYRRGVSFKAMIDETCELISTLLQTAGAGPRDTIHRSYAALFADAIGEHPLDADVTALRRRAAELVPGLTAGLERALGGDRSGWLDLLLANVAIPALPGEQLTVVHHYPAEQAALAALDATDERFALRFEVFCGGLELANGYSELTDAGEQRRRFDADAARRSADGMPAIEPDSRLLAALEHGLPDCCGVAVGFDRLLMCATGAADIADVTSFTL